MPKSLKTICEGAFRDCHRLKHVVLNDTLEELGREEEIRFGGAFENSAIESIEIPATLKRIPY